MAEAGTNFKQWATDCGISEKGMATLEKAGIKTVHDLHNLDDAGLTSLKLLVTDAKLIKAAMTFWAVAKPVATPTETSSDRSTIETELENHEHDHASGSGRDLGLPSGITITDVRQRASGSILSDAGKLYDNLLSHGDTILSQNVLNAGTSVNKSEHNFHETWQDPRHILTVKASSKKAIHITNHLTERTKKKCQWRRKGNKLNRLASTDADGHVIIMDHDDHPYSGISVHEWSGANCRVMAALLRSGDLKAEDIEFYLAYTTLIHELAESHDWESILDFDYMYRERQAEYGFPWGTNTNHLELQLLVGNQKQKFSQKPNYSHPNYHNHRDTRPLCRLYQTRNGQCPFGQSCKYKHSPNLFTSVSESNANWRNDRTHPQGDQNSRQNQNLPKNGRHF
jgi:hypothetical protein